MSFAGRLIGVDTGGTTFSPSCWLGSLVGFTCAGAEVGSAMAEGAATARVWDFKAIEFDVVADLGATAIRTAKRAIIPRMPRQPNLNIFFTMISSGSNDSSFFAELGRFIPPGQSQHSQYDHCN